MIAVGKIRKSVGLKGQVQVEPLSKERGRLLKIKDVLLGSDASTVRRSVVESAEARGTKTVLKFQGVNERTEADKLHGFWVFVDDERGMKAPSGSYFVHDIVGLKVLSEEGDDLGVVSDVVNLPGGDAWIVKRGSREAMIPAVKEFIRKVDVQGGCVVIRLIDGMME